MGTADTPSFLLMKMVAKTDDTMVFEVQEGHEFHSEFVYRFFGSPFSKPREVLNYELLE